MGMSWPIPLPPIQPPINPVQAGEAARQFLKNRAEEAILAGDVKLGKHLVDTPLERDLLHHWIQGSGEPVSLRAAEMERLSHEPQIEQAGRAIAAGDTAGMKRVRLENGEMGWRQDVDLNPATRRPGNEFDGSLGKARAYFDDAGRFVGVQDSYDFSNDSYQVDGINALGGSVGARNFEVRGGIIEQDSDLVVPPGPSATDAAESLGRRALDKAGDVAKDVAEGTWDAGRDALDRLRQLPLPLGPLPLF